jgi:HSP20 family protein
MEGGKKKKEEERAVGRWDPLAELDALSRWPFRELARRPFAGLPGWLEEAGRAARSVPAIDIAEGDGEYVVTAELPGCKKEDVTLELEENVLTLRGEKRSEREEKKEQRRYVERTYGSFSRSFTLPPNAEVERIDASFKDGVLTIRIPKAAAAKSRTVDIKS